LDSYTSLCYCLNIQHQWMNHLEKNSACWFFTTEIALYQEVILNLIWFPFTKISARPVWRKKGKRYSCPCACSEIEYKGGGKLHSFLTLALDGEVSGYLNTLVATPAISTWCSLAGALNQPRLHKMWGCWWFNLLRCDTVLMGEQVSTFQTVVPSSERCQDIANHSLSNIAACPTTKPESTV
jgi:hypothetical protein